MAIELAEIAAGLPLAASFAFAGGVSTLREGRRRSALNEALHELRRPLQALALAAPGDDAVFERSLGIASAAVRRLEREINGEPVRDPDGTVPVRALLEATAARWRRRAELEGRALVLRWSGPSAIARGSEFELSQALDNLIINGLEHGTGAVRVEGGVDLDRVRILVRDGGRRRQGAAGSSLAPRRSRLDLGGRRRHGHGLRVVRRAAACGGRFRLERGEEGTTAVLEFPLAGGGEG
jgi:hypothetical protein